jgi:hypothetical protein
MDENNNNTIGIGVKRFASISTIIIGMYLLWYVGNDLLRLYFPDYSVAIVWTYIIPVILMFFQATFNIITPEIPLARKISNYTLTSAISLVIFLFFNTYLEELILIPVAIIFLLGCYFIFARNKFFIGLGFCMPLIFVLFTVIFGYLQFFVIGY